MNVNGHFTKEELLQIREEYYKPLEDNNGLKNRICMMENNRERANGDFQRDYTRIMYSSSFRRLQGKMQLLGIRTDQFFRNRLTHSLEVAQIARSIAEEIGYSSRDIYVVEAGALAHDLGNPPFGHYGEKILNTLCKDIGGFEGNAQTLRILMEKERKKAEYSGLNLTIRTLLSVMKYFNKFKNSKNMKFIYDDTYDVLKEQIDLNDIKIRTLDVQIVDIADEIAYAAHDLEDALKLRCFTIEELLYEFILHKHQYPNANEQLKEIIKNVNNEALKSEQHFSSEEYSQIFRKELTSRVVNTLVNDVHLVKAEKVEKTGTKWDKELGFKEFGALAKGLKKLTFKCINKNDDIYFYEQQGEKIISGLFGIFINYPKYLPIEYRPQEDKIKEYGREGFENYKKRLVIDYIAGMMDSFAINTYRKFYGLNSLDQLYDFRDIEKQLW